MDYTKDGILIRELAEEKSRVKLAEDALLRSLQLNSDTNLNELDSELSAGHLNSNQVLSSAESPSGSNLNSSVAAILETFIEYLNKSNVTDGLGLDNETDGYVPYGERPETYIVPVLFAIIFIIGVLGNGTLILIFLKHRNMRNVPNMYICSLSVGDLLVIFFCVPFTSTVYTVESWPYGLLVCKFSEFIKDVSIGVSVFTLTALSADRYCAIVDPMKKFFPGGRAKRVTCITIAGIWIGSLVIALPSILFSYIRKIEHEDRYFLICYPFPPHLGPNYPKLIVIFKFLVYYAVPLCFIATFYVIMARHLVLSTRNMPGEAQGQAKQVQGRKKVAKMVLSFVVIFALCFFPNHLFFLWFYFDPNAESNFNEEWNIVRIAGFCLGFINSCINPITLYCVSGTFRKHFNKHLFCCICDVDGGPSRGAGGVSMSNSNYRLPGGERGGAARNGGGLAAHCRNNAVNSTRNRKCNWDSQSSASHHQLFSMTALNHHNPSQQFLHNSAGASTGIIMTTRLDAGYPPNNPIVGTADRSSSGGAASGTSAKHHHHHHHPSSSSHSSSNPNSTANKSNSNSNSTSPIGRGPGGCRNGPPPARITHDPPSSTIVDTEFTMTSFIHNADSPSMESLHT